MRVLNAPADRFVPPIQFAQISFYIASSRQFELRDALNFRFVRFHQRSLHPFRLLGVGDQRVHALFRPRQRAGGRPFIANVKKFPFAVNQNRRVRIIQKIFRHHLWRKDERPAASHQRQPRIVTGRLRQRYKNIIDIVRIA